MIITRAAAVRAAAAVTALGGLSTATTVPAQAATSTTTAVRPATRTADIDGDGRPDRATLSLSRRTATTEQFSLTVRTAAKRTSTVHATLPIPRGTTILPSTVLQGTAAADGVRGREILLKFAGDPSLLAGRYVVYTWRSGRLVVMPAMSASSPWTVGSAPTVDGYHVSTTAGRRVLVHRHLRRIPGTSGATARFSGTATTYVWSSNAWVRTRTARIASMDLATAQRISGCHGITWR